MKDLFGNEVIEREFARTPAETKRAKTLKYRRARGYAAPPGTGPVGETCKSCAHCYLHHTSPGGGGKNWYKCDLVKPTSGAATDLRLKWDACRHWKKRDELRGSTS